MTPTTEPTEARQAQPESHQTHYVGSGHAIGVGAVSFTAKTVRDDPSAFETPPFIVHLPIPDARLGKSSRPQFWTHRKLYNQHRELAGWALHAMLFGSAMEPWPAAVMDIHWQYQYGVEPDDDGVIVRCCAYRDGAQDACLVLNDKAITTGVVSFEKIKRQTPMVTLTFRRQEGARRGSS